MAPNVTATLNIRVQARDAGATAALQPTGKALDGIKKKAQAAAQAAGKLGTAITGIGDKSKLERLNQTLEKAGKSMQQLGASLATVGVSLGITGAVGVGAFKKVAGTAAEFEDKMKDLKSKVEKTTLSPEENEKYFVALTKKARDLGAETRYTAMQVADAMKYLAMAGQSPAEILQTIRPTLQLATASMMDLGQAADLATNMMMPFGLGANQMTRAVDVLATVATNSNTNVAELGQTMKYVGPVAAALGYSIEETAALAGALASGGIKADMAGTALRNMFLKLAAPSKTATETMERFHVSLVKTADGAVDVQRTLIKMKDAGMGAAEFKKMFDLRVVTAALSGLQTMPVYLNIMEELKNSAGRGARIEATMESGLSGGIRRLNSAAESLRITLGNTMLETLKAYAEKISNVLGVMDRWIQANPKIAEGLMKIFLVGSILLSVFGAVAVAIGGFILFLGPALEVIGAVVVAYGPWAAATTALRIAFKELFDIGGRVFIAFASGLVFMINNWEEVVYWVKLFYAELKNTFIIGTIIKGFETLADLLKFIVTTLLEKLNEQVGHLIEKWGILQKGWEKSLNHARELTREYEKASASAAKMELDYASAGRASDAALLGAQKRVKDLGAAVDSQNLRVLIDVFKTTNETEYFKGLGELSASFQISRDDLSKLQSIWKTAGHTVMGTKEEQIAAEPFQEKALRDALAAMGRPLSTLRKSFELVKGEQKQVFDEMKKAEEKSPDFSKYRNKERMKGLDDLRKMYDQLHEKEINEKKIIYGIGEAGTDAAKKVGASFDVEMRRARASVEKFHSEAIGMLKNIGHFSTNVDIPGIKLTKGGKSYAEHSATKEMDKVYDNLHAILTKTQEENNQKLQELREKAATEAKKTPEIVHDAAGGQKKDSDTVGQAGQKLSNSVGTAFRSIRSSFADVDIGGALKAAFEWGSDVITRTFQSTEDQGLHSAESIKDGYTSLTAVIGALFASLANAARVTFAAIGNSSSVAVGQMGQSQTSMIQGFISVIGSAGALTKGIGDLRDSAQLFGTVTKAATMDAGVAFSALQAGIASTAAVAGTIAFIITGIGAGVYTIVKYWDELSDLMNDFLNNAKKANPIIGFFASAGSTISSKLGSALKDVAIKLGIIASDTHKTESAADGLVVSYEAAVVELTKMENASNQMGGAASAALKRARESVAKLGTDVDQKNIEALSAGLREGGNNLQDMQVRFRLVDKEVVELRKHLLSGMDMKEALEAMGRPIESFRTTAGVAISSSKIVKKSIIEQLKEARIGAEAELKKISDAYAAAAAALANEFKKKFDVARQANKNLSESVSELLGRASSDFDKFERGVNAETTVQAYSDAYSHLFNQLNLSLFKVSKGFTASLGEASSALDKLRSNGAGLQELEQYLKDTAEQGTAAFKQMATEIGSALEKVRSAQAKVLSDLKSLQIAHESAVMENSQTVANARREILRRDMSEAQRYIDQRQHLEEMLVSASEAEQRGTTDGFNQAQTLRKQVIQEATRLSAVKGQSAAQSISAATAEKDALALIKEAETGLVTGEKEHYEERRKTLASQAEMLSEQQARFEALRSKAEEMFKLFSQKFTVNLDMTEAEAKLAEIKIQPVKLDVTDDTQITGQVRNVPVNLITQNSPAMGTTPPKTNTAMASGGIVPGGWGGGDTQLIFAEPGEGILTKQATLALGGKNFIDYVNSNLRLPRYATGGIVGGNKSYPLAGIVGWMTSEMLDGLIKALKAWKLSEKAKPPSAEDTRGEFKRFFDTLSTGMQNEIVRLKEKENRFPTPVKVPSEEMRALTTAIEKWHTRLIVPSPQGKTIDEAAALRGFINDTQAALAAQAMARAEMPTAVTFSHTPGEKSPSAFDSLSPEQKRDLLAAALIEGRSAGGRSPERTTSTSESGIINTEIKPFTDHIMGSLHSMAQSFDSITSRLTAQSPALRGFINDTQAALAAQAMARAEMPTAVTFSHTPGEKSPSAFDSLSPEQKRDLLAAQIMKEKGKSEAVPAYDYEQQKEVGKDNGLPGAVSSMSGAAAQLIAELRKPQKIEVSVDLEGGAASGRIARY
jgi:TP901 family phage tail tape measure protein